MRTHWRACVLCARNYEFVGECARVLACVFVCRLTCSGALVIHSYPRETESPPDEFFFDPTLNGTLPRLPLSIWTGQ